MSFNLTDPRDPARLEVVTPASSGHRVIGALNIVFACILSACGLCGGGYVMMISMIVPTAIQAEAESTAEREQAEQQARAVQIEQLKLQRETAQTDEERAAIDESIATVETQQAPEPRERLDLKPLVGNPLYMGYPAVDVLSALALNVAMLITGVGLLYNREWARRFAIWVAGVKIVRLILLYTVFVFVIVPGLVKTAGELLREAERIEQQNRQQAPQRGAPEIEMAQQIIMVYSTFFSVAAIGTMILGSIYPAVSIWVLTRPGVKVACGASLDSGRMDAA